MVNSAVHSHTPELLVSEVRGLVVRQVLLHRTEAAEAAAMRVTRQRFDPAGRMIAATDPRLADANRSTVYSLGGNALATESVDAGWRVALFGEAGQVLHGWDGRGTERQLEYDLLLRLRNIIEQNRCAERFAYGQTDAPGHNQCNQLVRHDDTAGSRLLQDYSLHGSVLSETRHFLLAAEAADWPSAEPDCNELLEPAGLQTCRVFNAQGEVLTQTDASGNSQLSTYNLAGQLHSTDLILNGSMHVLTLVSAIRYNAFNQVEQETAGNGVVSLYAYDQQDGRLTGLSAISADGTLLQQLDYSYDPVGNILLVNDASQPDRYCDNQLIEPISHYRYDTVYQLIEATGREVRNGASHGPALPGLQPLPTLDPCQVSNYKQNYSYDAAGNLLQMRHEGAHNFTRNMHVDPDSNRSLADDDGDVDFATSFDANGNLLQLVRGQVMGWDARNQLAFVTLLQRKDAASDEERYVYDGQGQRCRKISTAQASGSLLINEVRYLPGLEIRTTADGETLHVVTAQAGRNSVRVLHWEAGKPGAVENDQVRYSLGDHLGSSTLELDQQGGLISQESYYPFGGTAWWAARSAVEAKYKTVRYSGKERDASGLYYYGFRYYAPWLQRWINPDPAGDVDGLNLFGFVGNNPLNLFDPDGQNSQKARARWLTAMDSLREQRDTNDVSVRTFAPGIIGVSIQGTNETFAQIGMGLPRAFKGQRELTYLSIDSTYQSKVSGGSYPFAIKSVSGASIYIESEVPGSSHLAYINGGFYNFKGKVSPSDPTHAAVGKLFMGGEEEASVSIPRHYEKDYVALTMGDGSTLHSAPLLSTGGEVAFTENDLEQGRFQYGPATSGPGQLGHANTPNPRSGISFPVVFDGSSRTRLAVGSGGSRTQESGAYTMPEWAKIMLRLDKLNATPGWSANLDGGDSAALGIVSRSGEIIMDQSARGNPRRGIGNFLTFYKSSFPG